MPEIPWDFLAARLGRYLQLSYVSAVIAGAIILLCIRVETMNGTPAQNRSEISDQFKKVTSHRSILFVLILLVVLVITSYIVGTVTRYLTWWTVNKVRLVWMALMGLTGLGIVFYKLRRRFAEMAGAQAGKPPRKSKDMPENRIVSVGGRNFNVATPAGAAGYLWSMFSLMKPTAEQTWSNLISTYGESRVTEVLRPYPIHIPPIENWQMESVSEYCYFWLSRYAKDVAVTISATRTLIASSALVPTLFVPSALADVLGAENDIENWVARLEIWIVLVLFYLILSGQRNRGAASEVFRRFVLVQLLEDANSRIRDTRESLRSARGRSAELQDTESRP